MADVYDRVANRAASAASRIGMLVERHPELMSYGAYALVGVTFAVLVSKPGQLPIMLAYGLSMPLMLGLPALMVLRHRSRQAHVMNRLRGLYAMAEALVLTGQLESARRKLSSIVRWERHWKIGNSVVYRSAYGATIVAGTFAAALLHYVLYLHVYSHHGYGQRPHETLGVTLQSMVDDPGLFGWVFGFSVFAALAAFANLRDLEEEVWAEFYSTKLRSMLNAGRTVAAPRQRARHQSSGGANARELFGLSATFTQAELRRAWLRLVRELHPDRWAHAGEGVRTAKEAALKRVNAARDELMAHAMG